MAHQRDKDPILVLGRGLHRPWNEGTRLIARDVARAASTLRPVHVVSLTHEQFRTSPSDRLHIRHVYTQFSYGAWGDYVALPRIARTIQALHTGSRIGVAHLIGIPLALAPWLRRHGIRIVAHVPLAEHSYRDPAERMRAALGWRIFDRWVDAYACTSEHVRAQLAALGYPAAKLRSVPAPVDLQAFQRADRAAARAALGLPAGDFVVAYMGTISPLRFPAHAVLRALCIAADDIPNLRLAVCAPVSTHPYNVAWASGHLRQAISASGLPASLELRDLTEEQKTALYSAADVVLLPFSAPVAVEPPLTLLEAMACQALVVAAPAANRSRIVVDGANGATFDSPEELAVRLKQLHTLLAPQRAALGAAARATVVEQHSFTAVTRALAATWAALEAQETGATANMRKIDGVF